MSQKRSRAASRRLLVAAHSNGRHNPRRTDSGPAIGKTKVGRSTLAKGMLARNEYVCAIEKNQTGKYSVRVRAVYGHGAWTLPVYFLAGSFDGAVKKLKESLQILQKNEDRLRFWGVEHSDDPNMAGDLLPALGLHLDRRLEFPNKAAELAAPRELPLRASMLRPLHRILANSIERARPHTATSPSD